MNRQISILGFCINLKVVAAVAAVGLGVFLIAPRFTLAALPFLLVAICPLSCIWMMRGMRGSDKKVGSTRGSSTDHLRQLEEEVAHLREARAAATPAQPWATGSETARRDKDWQALPGGEPAADRPAPS